MFKVGKNKNGLDASRGNWGQRETPVAGDIEKNYGSTAFQQVRRDDIWLFIPVRYHFTPARVAKTQKTAMSIGEDVCKQLFVGNFPQQEALCLVILAKLYCN